ncbi:MAG: serine/threonine-protein phosphatase [Proteobacteria bacterium]|nr:serine/threonine-protein phosphatase [Pseudomonadota bacterium]
MASSGTAAQLVVRADMERPLEVAFASGNAAVHSSRAPHKESDNEDAALWVPSGPGRGVVAVADGVGGQPGGASASERALACLERAVGSAPESEASLRAAILDGLEAANREIIAAGTGAATTLAAVELDGASMRPYHVGDAAILVVGQRGKLKLQTVSHSPVGYGVEAGLLNEREALHHEDRHLISNAVGVADMRIEVGSPLELAPRDTLLLATDGVLDNASVAEIADHIRCGPLLEAAERLAGACRRRMQGAGAGQPSKPDDLTFILFRRG